MAKREKKQIISGVTSEQAEQAFADFATSDARIVEINADMDVQFTKIREKYQSELAQLEADKSKAFETIQVYATENKDALFSKKKSIETVHGVYGFRTGTPKLKTLKGFTWSSVTTLLEKLMPSYVRKVVEPAKDKLLADREKKGIAAKMKEVGIEVVQDETFYIERKTEETTA
ncbi:MAG: host-nuclease inhibitor Gam family protein [Dysgonomonas sp.]|nr:host-nuclease inhibitor Gam family protein [Dysgonomonas sp.]